MKYDYEQKASQNEPIDTICPVCGKNFIPAPYHAYKVGTSRVCTWTCQMRGERELIKNKSKGYEDGLKAVLMFDLRGRFLREFLCAKQAAETFHISLESVRKCCRGQTSMAGGFVFKYKEKCEPKNQEEEEVSQ